MTEILEDLHQLANRCIELDGTGEANKYEFDDEDLINASHVFMTVFGNRHAIVALKRLGLDGAIAEAEKFGEDLSALIRNYTGFDTQTYYHRDKNSPNAPKAAQEK